MDGADDGWEGEDESSHLPPLVAAAVAALAGVASSFQHPSSPPHPASPLNPLATSFELRQEAPSGGTPDWLRYSALSDSDGPDAMSPWSPAAPARHRRRRERPFARPPPHPVPIDLVRRCFNCLATDHVAAACRNPSRCLRCRQEGHRSCHCRRGRSPHHQEA
uniref:CCHC-type domain-containing protein n=1 Tax=Setaria viridis TaxID=4556 RepID=A0A4V6D152_SETVI|nr:hypothetical protein SEVIR_9G218200v2 [Setaria viridis]